MRRLVLALLVLFIVAPLQAQTPITILARETVLDDGQFRALPSTGVEVVPAPGAGKAIQIWKATARLKTTTGYTVANEASWVLMGASGGYHSTPLSIHALVESSGLDRMFFFVVSDLFSPSSGAFEGMPSRSGAMDTSLLDNQPLVIKDDWWGVSDYTGGASGNTLTVTVYYLVVDL